MKIKRDPNPDAIKLYGKVDYELFFYPTDGNTIIACIKSMPCLSGRLIPVKSFKEIGNQYSIIKDAYNNLFSARESQTKKRKRSAAAKTKKCSYARDEANIIVADQTVYLNGNETIDDYYNGTCCNCETKEIEYRFRGLEKLKRGFNGKTKEVIFHTIENRSVSANFNSGKKFGHNEIHKIGQALQKALKRNFELSYCVIVYEPNWDGSWHFHLLITFVEKVPDVFEDWFAGWAKKYNTKNCSNQTYVRRLTTKESVIRAWEYLDPTSPRKRKKAIYYPQNFRNICVFGNRTTPASMSVSGKTLNELLDKVDAIELEDFAKSYTISYDDTGAVMYTIKTNYFKIAKNRLEELFEPRQSVLYIDGIYEYLMYSEECRGSPTLPK